MLTCRSWQTAPSYSYYDRPTSLADLGLPLKETGACLSRTLTSPFPQTSSFRLIRVGKPEDFQFRFQIRLVAFLTNDSISAPT